MCHTANVGHDIPWIRLPSQPLFDIFHSSARNMNNSHMYPHYPSRPIEPSQQRQPGPLLWKFLHWPRCAFWGCRGSRISWPFGDTSSVTRWCEAGRSGPTVEATMVSGRPLRSMGHGYHTKHELFFWSLWKIDDFPQQTYFQRDFPASHVWHRRVFPNQLQNVGSHKLCTFDHVVNRKIKKNNPQQHKRMLQRTIP